MQKPITGIMIYYYFVCKRKLWYFYNSINMEQENENVKIGKLLDEESYSKEEKHINIDDVINIDFIRTKGIIHEVKKSNKIEEASIWQLKYYLYYLNKRGVQGIKGKIDYPLLRQTVEVLLMVEDITRMDEIIKNIYEIVGSKHAYSQEKINICKQCAYHDLCFI